MGRFPYADSRCWFAAPRYCWCRVSRSNLSLGARLPPPRRLPSEPGAASFRSDVNEVIVPVTVTDDKGRFVSNLEKKRLPGSSTKGKPQNIEFFSRERAQPVVAGFLLDLSNSSRTQAWKHFQDAATELALTTPARQRKVLRLPDRLRQ